MILPRRFLGRGWCGNQTDQCQEDRPPQCCAPTACRAMEHPHTSCQTKDVAVSRTHYLAFTAVGNPILKKNKTIFGASDVLTGSVICGSEHAQAEPATVRRT